MQEVIKGGGCAAIAEIQELADAQRETTINPEVQKMVKVNEDAYQTTGQAGNPGTQEKSQNYAGPDADSDVLTGSHEIKIYHELLGAV